MYVRIVVKKIIAVIAITMLLTNNVHARHTDRFFANLDLGTIFMNSVSQEYQDNVTKKLNTDTNFLFGVGIGYYMLDTIRADLMFHYMPNNELYIKDSKHVFDTVLNNEINSFTVNLMGDLFPLGPFKLVGGGGIGVAQVKSKLTVSGTEDGQAFLDTYKSKEKTSFTYTANIGLSYDLAQDINIELKYSYRDFNKTDKLVNMDNNTLCIEAKKLKGKAIILTSRIDI